MSGCPSGMKPNPGGGCVDDNPSPNGNNNFKRGGRTTSPKRSRSSRPIKSVPKRKMGGRTKPIPQRKRGSKISKRSTRRSEWY